VAEAIWIKQTHEEVELIGLPFVRGSGHQQERVGIFGDGFTNSVTLGAFDGVVASPASSQVVCLVKNGDVPRLVEIIERITNRDPVRLGVIVRLLSEID